MSKDTEHSGTPGNGNRISIEIDGLRIKWPVGNVKSAVRRTVQFCAAVAAVVSVVEVLHELASRI